MNKHTPYTEIMEQILSRKARVIAAAAGRTPADLVIKNAAFVNVFSNKISHGDIAIAEGLFVGIGEYEGRERSR